MAKLTEEEKELIGQAIQQAIDSAPPPSISRCANESPIVGHITGYLEDWQHRRVNYHIVNYGSNLDIEFYTGDYHCGESKPSLRLQFNEGKLELLNGPKYAPLLIVK